MKLLKTIWNFLWRSNSFLSWIVDIVLIFLFVKFVFYPLVGLILSTSVPFVIIESKSMEHESNFEQWFSLHGFWYLENNISKEEMKGWPWRDGLYEGDIIVVKGEKQYKKGDVIIFKVSTQKNPIIHRIVKVESKNNETIFSTKGDRNDSQWPYELEVREDQVLGKAIFRIPKIGWIKLFVVRLLT